MPVPSFAMSHIHTHFLHGQQAAAPPGHWADLKEAKNLWASEISNRKSSFLSWERGCAVSFCILIMETV